MVGKRSLPIEKKPHMESPEDWDKRKVTFDMFLMLTSSLASLIRS